MVDVFGVDGFNEAKLVGDLGLQLLSTCYLGTRQLNLREAKDVQTPADLEGIKLRMPGSDAWLFLGEALGANPRDGGLAGNKDRHAVTTQTASFLLGARPTPTLSMISRAAMEISAVSIP